MKKFALLLVCLAIVNILSAGCAAKNKVQPINYKRKLVQYLPSDNNSATRKTIDLSEGPKTRYDAKFGPNDLNFDIKIKNPY